MIFKVMKILKKNNSICQFGWFWGLLFLIYNIQLLIMHQIFRNSQFQVRGDADSVCQSPSFETQTRNTRYLYLIFYTSNQQERTNSGHATHPPLLPKGIWNTCPNPDFVWLSVRTMVGKIKALISIQVWHGVSWAELSFL